MRKEVVEIISDATNAAIMRHPNRKFPGILMQGDALDSVVRSLETAFDNVANNRTDDGLQTLNQSLTQFRDLRQHYKMTLLAHDMPLPFSDAP